MLSLRLSGSLKRSVCALLAALAVCPASGAAAARSELMCANIPMPADLVHARVVSVTDGDTIVVTLTSGALERVRLIGVDAPELHWSQDRDQDRSDVEGSREGTRAMGERARQFAVTRLAGRDVFLGFDVQRRDRYGRLLAYVWLPDERSFNVLIVREGYARVMTVPPNVRHADVLLACEREARIAGRGLWAR